MAGFAMQHFYEYLYERLYEHPYEHLNDYGDPKRPRSGALARAVTAGVFAKRCS